ncbi:MAG: cytochrome c oxidase assembly protein [Paenisporosarcina sp.]|nr:cytochrome c oxidase assembly protein [Paenisporosarcina sp.]
MANSHSHVGGNEGIFQLLLVMPFLVTLVLYGFAVVLSNQRHKKQWPLIRSASWIVGILCASLAVIGPIAERAHEDFRAHMVGHVLLGMLAPLLLVLATPMTLVLRTLPVRLARRLARVLKSLPVLLITNPLFAACLNMGGLWLLYTTELYVLMQQNMISHIGVHIHVFLAGYLFTMSIIYMEPTSHRLSFTYRSIVLVLAFAAHGVLSKYIYAHPPNGISAAQAEIGGQIMYFGGDAIEFVLIFIFCFQWYKDVRPRGVLLPSYVK